MTAMNHRSIDNRYTTINNSSEAKLTVDLDLSLAQLGVMMKMHACYNPRNQEWVSKVEKNRLYEGDAKLVDKLRMETPSEN
jgi:hypothetical protein